MTGTSDDADGRIGCGGFPGPGQVALCTGEQRSERGLPQRAEAIGCDTMCARIDGYNISQGRAIFDHDLPL